MNAPSPVRALRQRLGRLRRRIRTLLTLQGVARWIAAAALVGLLFFLADYFLDLPLGVRRFVRLGLLDHPTGLATGVWIVLLGLAGWLTVWATRARLGAAPLFAFLAAGVAGLLAWLAWVFLRPTGATLSDEELALSVERRYRGLNDRLAAALDFEEELTHPSRGESAAMMQAVVDDAAQEAGSLEFSRAVSARRALTWTAIALGCVLLVALGGHLAQQTVDLWARRSLLLEDVSWPRATTVVAVELQRDGSLRARDAEIPYEVSVGRSLTVYAEARGRVPDEVRMVDEVREGRPLVRRLYGVAERPGLFQIEIRDVREAFAFTLQGGDDEDALPRYQVEIVVPPQVVGVRTHLTYPPYLGRPAESIEGGTATVPEGTVVRVAFGSDVPVASARAILGEEVLPATARGDGRFEVAFTAESTTRYRLVLETQGGRASDPAAGSFEIVVEKDRVPSLQWLYPLGSLERAPQGRAPLLASATDDHGIASLVLEIRAPGGETRKTLLPHGAAGGDDALDVLDGELGRPRVRAYVPLDLPELRLGDGPAPAPGDRLAVRLVATDSKGQVREGAWAALDVFSAPDMERALVTLRSPVRSQLELILEEQRARRAQAGDLARSELGASERDLLKSIQFAQGKIAQDTDRAVRDLIRIFNRWVYDRLGSDGPTAAVLAELDRYHRTTYGEAAPAPSPDAPPYEAGDPVFPYAVYEQLVTMWKDKRIFDSGLLDRMLAVLDTAVDAAAHRAPTARAVAERVAADEEEIAALLRAQDELVQALEGTLAAMSSWQNLNDLILRLRRLVEEQEALHERFRASDDAESSTPRRQ